MAHTMNFFFLKSSYFLNSNLTESFIVFSALCF